MKSFWYYCPHPALVSNTAFSPLSQCFYNTVLYSEIWIRGSKLAIEEKMKFVQQQMLCYKGSNLNYFQFGGNSAKRFCNKVQNLSCNSSCGDQSCDLFLVPIFFGRYLHFHFHSFLVIAMNSRIFVAVQCNYISFSVLFQTNSSLVWKSYTQKLQTIFQTNSSLVWKEKNWFWKTQIPNQIQIGLENFDDHCQCPENSKPNSVWFGKIIDYCQRLEPWTNSSFIL